LAALGFLLASHAASNAHAAPPTHCLSHETTIFSCSSGHKIASICASKDLSPTTGTLQYRFGTSHSRSLDLSLPSSPAHPQTFAKGASLAFSGGGGAFLRLRSSDYAYVAYTGIGKGWQKDGIAVERNGKLIANFPCTSEVKSSIGDSFFSHAGIPEDTSEFDIP
jgi:hypothetical protein